MTLTKAQLRRREKRRKQRKRAGDRADRIATAQASSLIEAILDRVAQRDSGESPPKPHDPRTKRYNILSASEQP